MSNKSSLKRAIGFWGMVSNTINIIVGAGIFILPAIVAGSMGITSIFAYLTSGLLMILIMLCFADIGSKIPATGGAYAYIEKSFGRFPGYLTTNLFVFGAAVTANAAVANGLAGTLAYFMPVFKTGMVRYTFFFLLFGSLAWVNVRGLSQGMLLVNINTIAKLLPLLFIILAGWIWIEPEHMTYASSPSITTLGEMSLILIFAFTGAETALNVSGEVRNPKKNIPRAILVSMGIVLVLYILIQVSVQGILGEEAILFKEAPLAETARRMIGPAGASFVILGAVFAMFGNLSGLVLNMPRLIFAAAQDKVIFPASLGRLHPRFNTPFIAVIVYAMLGFAFSVFGEFKQLAMLSSASFLLIYLGVIMATIKQQLKGKAVPGSFNVPGGVVIPILAILAIGWFLSNLSGAEMWGMIIFLGFFSLLYGIMILPMRRRRNAGD